MFTNSDSFLKLKFSAHLAYLVESGISFGQKKKLTENNMRWYISNLYKSDIRSDIFPNNISQSQIVKYISLWIQKGCFSFYLDEVCGLGKGRDKEVPVQVEDLTCVWILLFSCLLVCFIGLLSEV